MQQAASRCWRTRGAGTRFPGLPTPNSPAQGAAALWFGGSPGGSSPIRSPGRQLPGPALHLCSPGLFPFGFPALAPGLPPCQGGRAPLPLSQAAGPAARSIPTIFSTAVAARSWCWLFLASPPAAAAGKGLRRVVLHCRCWFFGLVGAVSPWDTHGAQSWCCLCSQGLCRCCGDPVLLWVPAGAGTRRKLKHPRALRAASAARCLQAPSRGGRLCHLQLPPRCRSPSIVPAPCTAPSGAGTGDGQHEASLLPGQPGRCR